MRDRWEVDIKTVLAGTRDIVVLEVDGRGSGGRGEEWYRMLVGHVGDLDVEDQIESLK